MTFPTLRVAGLLVAFSAGRILAAGSLSALGTAAPPTTAGLLQLVPFDVDPTPEFSGVTSVASPLGGSLLFGTAVEHRYVPYSWGSWSHDFEGDVYSTPSTVFSLTLTPPPGTGALVFYAEPSDLAVVGFTISAAGIGTLSESIDGDGGAAGFLVRSAAGHSLGPITVTSTASFAVGEFSIAAVPEASTGFAAVMLAGVAGLAWRRRQGA